MTIENLKQLKALIKLCQEQGVRTVELDGIKLELGSLPVKSKKYKALQDNFDMPLEAQLQVPQMSERIDTDELTDEQKLFYSAQ